MSFPPVSRGICIAHVLSSVSFFALWKSSRHGPRQNQTPADPRAQLIPESLLGILPGMPLTMTSKCRSRCFRVGVHDGFEFALTMTSSWRSPCPGICRWASPTHDTRRWNGPPRWPPCRVTSSFRIVLIIRSAAQRFGQLPIPPSARETPTSNPGSAAFPCQVSI